MEDEVKDGGAAFPMPSGPQNYAEDGMSLRDWFAGQALAGLLAGQARDAAQHNHTALPAEAYAIADALLSARKDPAP